MTPEKNFLEGLNNTEQLLNDVMFMIENRAKPTYFNRNPKMGFKEIIMFSLNLIRKSIQLELDNYFKLLNSEDINSIRKQSYSEARLKVLPEAFEKIFYNNIKWFYNDDSFKTFKGYRISAIDGSKFEINNSKEMKEVFGSQKNQFVEVARAQIAALYDIENDKIIAATIEAYDKGEREIAIQLIEKLKLMGLKNDLIILDRGYPSTDIASYLENSGIKYLMRVSTGFLKAIVNTQTNDEIVKIIDNQGKILYIRVIKVKLDSGITEILMTNLTSEEFSTEELKALYFRRWRIEEKYDEFKNTLQVENFTGDKEVAVKQDFYATMYLANMASLAKAEADNIIEERNEGKTLKYKQKVNTNILIGKLKNSFILMMIEENIAKRTEMFRKIMSEISRNVIPIRPGRSNMRNKKTTKNKFQLNQKNCL